ncbi:MAG: TrmB family transcriptional regulator [Candidatus Aenigmarchaeota archaeon]|nr:TrmB family transcriptional regulator [Candidatus Aenigmarchaeota archaeon]
MVLASNKVMDALKGIGLNLYERKLWVALLARGTSTAGELSEIANVPRSRSYDILQSLAEKGFVIAQPAKPLRYVAIPPGEALERAKRKLEEDMKLTVQRIDELKTSPVMKELSSVHSTGLSMISTEEMAGALKGKGLVMQQMGSMFKTANKKINILTTGDGLNDIFENHFSDLKKAADRGVKVQIAVSGDSRSSPAAKSLDDLPAIEVRSVNTKEIPIGGRFAVVDGKELVFSLTDTKVHNTQDMAFWSKSEHAAGNVMEPLFKLAWNNSKKL